MAKHHLFLALSSPQKGRSEDFHRWYDAFHLQDVVDYCPGFERGHRYWISPLGGEHDPRWPSLALYDLAADDVALLHREVGANVHKFTPADGVFDDDHVAWVYTPRDDATSVMDLWPGPADDMLMLSFDDRAPSPEALLNGAIAVQTLVRHADQRDGNTPFWQFLTIARLPRQHATQAASAYHASAAPAATWLFEGRGQGAISRRAE